MSNPRLHQVDRELRRAILTIGEELRRARLNAGLRQRDIAKALHCSIATISRAERGLLRHVTVEYLFRHAAVVGLVGRFALFPAGRPTRDLPQTKLLDRLRMLLNALWHWRTEVGMPIPGDLRAWDAEISQPGCRIGIDAITRLGDVQAQSRAALLKGRDSGTDRVLLLIRDSAANRRALAVAMDLVRGSFPLDTRHVLAALRAGRDPGANGIVVL